MQKNIIITGTSRGIGFELVKLFSKAGHQVLALSRNKKPVEELNLENVKSVSFDIQQEEDQQKVRKFVEENWKKIDILIHNGGEFTKNNFEKMNLNDLISIYKNNVFSDLSLLLKLIDFFNLYYK